MRRVTRATKNAFRRELAGDLPPPYATQSSHFRGQKGDRVEHSLGLCRIRLASFCYLYGLLGDGRGYYYVGGGTIIVDCYQLAG